MIKTQIALTTEESTFLAEYFIKVRDYVRLGDKEEQEIEKRIYQKIKDSGYLDKEVVKG